MDWSKHQVLEKNSILLLIGILIVVAIGGLVEIAPLFWLSSTIEKVVDIPIATIMPRDSVTEAIKLAARKAKG